jgi:hypothetical protein
VERARALSGAKFRNLHAIAEKNDESLKSVGINARLTSQRHPQAVVAAQGGKAYAPKTTGRFLRTYGENGPVSGTVRALAYGRSGDERFLAKRKGVDATLDHAGLQHELGEVHEMNDAKRKVPVQGADGKPARDARGMVQLEEKRVVHPHASHLGVSPILREDMAVMHDPEARDLMDKVRQRHPDDAHVAKLKRQMGYHPNSPIQPGTRAARALEDRLAATSKKLHSETKMKNVMNQVMQPNGAVVRTAPGGAAEAATEVMNSGSHFTKTIMEAAKEKGFRGRLSKARDVADAFGKLRRAGMVLKKTVG